MPDPRMDPRSRSGSRMAAHLIEHQGGFSLGAGGRLPGEGDYMVARPGTERPLSEQVQSNVVAAEIRRHATSPEFSPEISRGAYLGGWGGAVELADAYTNKGLAVQAGMFNRQHAIYDVGGGRDIDARNYTSEAIQASPQIGHMLQQEVSRGEARPMHHPSVTQHDPSIEAEWNADRDQL